MDLECEHSRPQTPDTNETTARHIATSTLPIRQRLLRSGKHEQHVLMRPWDESIQGLTQGTARRAAESPRPLVQHTCADGAVEGSYVGCNSRSRLSMHSYRGASTLDEIMSTSHNSPSAPAQSLTGPSEQWASPRNALFPVPSHVHADISPGRRDGLNVGQLPRQQHRIVADARQPAPTSPADDLADSPEDPREQYSTCMLGVGPPANEVSPHGASHDPGLSRRVYCFCKQPPGPHGKPLRAMAIVESD
ncbi:hypothetical protein EDB80DRAFT_681312 [Ilyonectria destructans]|nr:hypothetical protein EDB80DRAFT_681312 [Ilyonectria destructans]